MAEPHEVSTAEPGCAEFAARRLRGDGFVVVRGALDTARISPWVTAVEARYRELESLVAEHGIWGAAGQLPPGTRYQAPVAALGIDAVAGWEALAHSLDSMVWAASRALLGGQIGFDLDICWLRRQYPPARRSPGQEPHRFHQDGAYGMNFLETAPGDRELLPIVVAWMPFVTAGGAAPGLEFVTEGPRGVLGLDELDDKAIEARWPAANRVRPIVAFGDVVLLAGQALHRTWVTDAMSEVRTCAELRIVQAEPLAPRLTGHAILDLGV